LFVLDKVSAAAPIVSSRAVAYLRTGALGDAAGKFPGKRTYTLINAGAGSLHIDDTSKFNLADPTNSTSFGIPFLYKATLTTDGNASVTNNSTALKADAHAQNGHRAWTFSGNAAELLNR